MKYMKLGSKPDLFQTDGNNIRYVSTELATDITVIVGDVKFFLHKFPLLSKSGLLQKLVSEDEEENMDEINVSDIPGGPSAFETCAKFCYNMTVTLNAYNVITARCASEYLEMHEAIDKGNLIYKIDVFLNSSILKSWKDSIIMLQTTKNFLSMSEDLKLVTQCIDSIASKASIDPSEVEWSYTYNRKKLGLENSIIESQWNGVKKDASVPKDWWVEDLSDLDLENYKNVIMAIKNKGKSSYQVIGEALKAYVYKRIPGFSKDIIKGCAILETVVWLLPKEKGSVSCSFMLKLLKLARLVDSSCVKYLIERIGKQMHEARVSDLLINRYEGDEMTYDVDVVKDIVEVFLMDEKCEEVHELEGEASSSKVVVAKLIDAYLAQVSKDPKLSVSKFVEVAEMVTDSCRPVHDGLYWAIDVYLKEHPGLDKPSKKKLCNLLDIKKLTPDACLHAVQNELLPLRLVVQILFLEQIRSRLSSTPSASTPDDPDTCTAPCTQNGASCASASTRSANTEDDWATINSIKSAKFDNGTVNQKKGLVPKKLLRKLWSNKGSVDNSGSDTSESVGREEVKSTPSRNMRHSVS